MANSTNNVTSPSFVIGKFFSKLGQSLMLPIAVLPIAGLLLRLGQADLLNLPFVSSAGGVVFDNLAILFALGVALGFSKDDHGSVVLSAFVGIIIFNKALSILNSSLNMGVFAGIFMGVTTAMLYNKYNNIKLVNYLAFFGGKRFIPIVTGLSAVILAFIFSFVWPIVGTAIAKLGNLIIDSNNIGLFIYGVLNRLLIPLGLHHILNSLFWFQFGDFVNSAGTIVNGDLNRFFAGDPTAGKFMAGFFPVMMFGLPAAALAMIITAKPAKRTIASGILLSAALTAFLTGVTEPLEFSFMFLAFPLYVVHAVLTGISLVVMNIFEVKLGFTFSAGLFDYVISGKLGNNPLRLIPIGLVFFAVYFVIFMFAIKTFNIKTLGREDDETNTTPINTNTKAENSNIGLQYINALGGKQNIQNLNYCTTRLRIDVKDSSKANETALKQLGAVGVIKSNQNHLQVVIGAHVESVANTIKQAL